MGMEELHKDIGGIINYCGGDSCCFGRHCLGLL
jgi:hypothetical protein